MIYMIPIVGFVVAMWECGKAQDAYFACHSAGRSCWVEFNATWAPFNHLTDAFLSTMAFIVFCWIAAAVVGIIIEGRKAEA